MTTSGVTPRRDELGQDVGGVAFERDRARDALPAPASSTRASAVVESSAPLVDVPRRQPALDARRVDLDDERDAAVHRDGERLGAAHAAETGGHDEPAGQACRRNGGAPARRASRRCPAGCPACRCRSSCRPSSGRTSSGRDLRDRGNCSHVAQAGHEQRVGDEHARRPGCVRKTATGLPDCTSSVSSCSSRRSVATIASKAGQLRAARPDPP